MERKIKNRKDRHFSPVGLIFAIILFIGFGMGSFFLYRYVIGPSWFYTNDSTTSQQDIESENQYNKLLAILNSGLETSEAKADTLISFSFESDHFIISAKCTNKIYAYDVNIGERTDTKQALDFVLSHDLNGEYTVDINRYNVSSSTDFDNKYITSGVTGKYCIGEQGTTNIVFATIRNGGEITVINGVELSTALLDSYSPTKIVSSNPLFNLYNYIIGK